MGYPCYYNYNKNCDACGYCQESNEHQVCCSECGRAIEENEMYFEIDDDILCRECTEDIYGRYID